MSILRTSLCVFFAFGVLASSLAVAQTRNPTQRQREEQACYNDAMKFCQDAVPDEDKITVCMTAKKSMLSSSCQKMFDDDAKAKG